MIYPAIIVNAQGDLYNLATALHPVPAIGGMVLRDPMITGDLSAGAHVVTPNSKQGRRYPTGNSQFYNNMVFNPSEIDLGNLTSVQTRTISLWNGFDVPVSVSQVIGESLAGITLTQPVDAPFTMGPLQEVTYSLSASTDGPAVINGDYRWTIDATDYVIPVTGRRLVLLMVEPNWSSQVIESLEWLTDVIKAYSGKEQRRCLRKNARRKFEFDFMVQGLAAQEFENQLWGWQNRPYATPVFTDPCPLTVDLDVGTSVVPLNTLTYSFDAYELAMIIDSSGAYEVVQIAEVSDTILLLSNPTQYAWSKGCTVYPMITARLPTETPYKRVTGHLIQGKLALSCEVGSIGAYTPTADPVTTFNGYEVITYQPNWSGGIDFSGGFGVRTFDSATGKVDIATREDYAKLSRQHQWLLPSRAAILAYREMLYRLKGRFGTVYVPTWNSDFTLARAHYASESALYVLPNSFRQLVGVDPNRNKIMIRLKSGVTAYFTIDTVTADGDYDVLGLTSPFGIEITPDNIVGIHLLLLSRLAADRVELTWHNTNVATSTLTFETVAI